jgi:hypothetical protein
MLSGLRLENTQSLAFVNFSVKKYVYNG